MLPAGLAVTKGMKAGDIDPRCEARHCFTVSDKARAIGGGVLEGLLYFGREKGLMERLILCGGGHVSLELAHMAGRLEFELIVIDDRRSLPTRPLPHGRRVMCAPFLEALDELGSREDDYYAILTRGHAFDRDCLEHVLRGKYAYVGMIGSRTKVAAVYKALREEGFSQEMLDGVYSPIGLSIGGQTPAEIAVAIAAQLIQVRAQRGPGAVKPPEGPGVLCTIIEKHGSAPRGVGTWMLVRPDGSCAGTIGGGAVEYQARLHALELWAGRTEEKSKHYDLTHAAVELGMVCGGKIQVEFEVRR